MELQSRRLSLLNLLTPMLHHLSLRTLTATLLIAGCWSALSADEVQAQPKAPDRPEDIAPLLPGEQIPDVMIRGVDGARVPLRSVVRRMPTVLIFYRGGWCPYCNVHLNELQEIEEDLRESGYQIIAVSPDRHEKLRESVEKQALTYSLYSDSDMGVARAFGLAFRVPDSTVQRYRTFNIDLDDASGEHHHLLPVPAVYLVGTDGMISFLHANVNYRVRLAGEVIMAAARSLLADEATPKQ